MPPECGPGCGHPAPNGLLWILGVIGAAIYFMPQAKGFWPKVVAFLKALVWPVFVVWKLLEFLKA